MKKNEKKNVEVPVVGKNFYEYKSRRLSIWKVRIDPSLAGLLEKEIDARIRMEIKDKEKELKKERKSLDERKYKIIDREKACIQKEELLDQRELDLDRREIEIEIKEARPNYSETPDKPSSNKKKFHSSFMDKMRSEYVVHSAHEGSVDTRSVEAEIPKERPAFQRQASKKINSSLRKIKTDFKEERPKLLEQDTLIHEIIPEIVDKADEIEEEEEHVEFISKHTLLRQKEQQLLEYECRLDNMRKDLGEYREIEDNYEISRMQIAIYDMNVELDDKDVLIGKQSDTLKNVQDKMLSLSKRMKAKDKEIDDKKATITALQDKIDRKQDAIASLEVELSEEIELRKVGEQMIDEVEKACEIMIQDKNKELLAMKSNMRKIEENGKQIEKNFAKKEQQKNDEIKVLKEEIHEKENIIKEKNVRIYDLEEAQNNVDSAANDLKTEIKTLVDVNNSLSETLRNKKEEIFMLEIGNTTQKELWLKVTEVLSWKEAELNSTNDFLSNVNDVLLKTDTEIGKLQEILAKLEQDIERREDMLHKFGAQLRKLEEENKYRKSTQDAAGSKVKVTFDEKRRELMDTFNDVQEEKDAELESKINDLKDRESEIQMKQNAYEKKKLKLREYEEQLSMKLKNIRELEEVEQQHSKNKRIIFKKVLKDLDEKAKEIKFLKRDINRKEDIINNLEIEMSDREEVLKNMMEGLNNQSRDANNEMTTNSRILQLEKEKERTEEMVALLKAELIAKAVQHENSVGDLEERIRMIEQVIHKKNTEVSLEQVLQSIDEIPPISEEFDNEVDEESTLIVGW